MIQRRIYKVKDSSWRGDRKKEKENTVVIKLSLYLTVINIHNYGLLELKVY